MDLHIWLWRAWRLILNTALSVDQLLCGMQESKIPCVVSHFRSFFSTAIALKSQSSSEGSIPILVSVKYWKSVLFWGSVLSAHRN